MSTPNNYMGFNPNEPYADMLPETDNRPEDYMGFNPNEPYADMLPVL